MALYKQKKMTGKRSNGHAQGRGVGRGGGGWRAVDAMHITESKFERCTTAEHGGRRSVRRRGWREGWRGRYGGGGQVSRRKRQPSPRNGGYEKGAANVRRERVKHQAVAPGHSDRTDPRVERRHTVGTPHDAIGKNTARGRNPARCVAIDKPMKTYRYVSGDDGHGGREPRHSEGGRAATGRRGGRAAAIRGAPTTAASRGGGDGKWTTGPVVSGSYTGGGQGAPRRDRRAATERRGGRAAAIRGAPTTAASRGGATAKGRRGRWCQAHR